METNISPINLGTKKDFSKAMKAFQIVRGLSESELETLEILSNSKERDLVLSGLEESKRDKVYPLRSILEK